MANRSPVPPETFTLEVKTWPAGMLVSPMQNANGNCVPKSSESKHSDIPARETCGDVSDGKSVAAVLIQAE
jgi:hypothetical protein